MVSYVLIQSIQNVLDHSALSRSPMAYHTHLIEPYRAYAVGEGEGERNVADFALYLGTYDVSCKPRFVKCTLACIVASLVFWVTLTFPALWLPRLNLNTGSWKLQQIDGCF